MQINRNILKDLRCTWRMIKRKTEEERERTDKKEQRHWNFAKLFGWVCICMFMRSLFFSFFFWLGFWENSLYLLTSSLVNSWFLFYLSIYIFIFVLFWEKFRYYFVPAVSCTASSPPPEKDINLLPKKRKGQMVGKEAGVWRQSGVKWSWVWGKRAWGQWVLVSGGKSSLRSSEVRLVAPFVCPIAARDRWVIDFPLHDDSSLFFSLGLMLFSSGRSPRLKSSVDKRGSLGTLAKEPRPNF